MFRLALQTLECGLRVAPRTLQGAGVSPPLPPDLGVRTLVRLALQTLEFGLRAAPGTLQGAGVGPPLPLNRSNTFLRSFAKSKFFCHCEAPALTVSLAPPAIVRAANTDGTPVRDGRAGVVKALRRSNLPPRASKTEQAGTLSRQHANLVRLVCALFRKHAKPRLISLRSLAPTCQPTLD